VAINHVMRQAERDAEFAHFILEQLAQRFEQLEVELFGQAADVVMALDGVRLPGFRSGGFDHVGVDRSLRQPAGVAELAGLGLENLDKLAADDLAFLLGIDNSLQVAHELRRRVDVHHLDAEIAGKGVHHLFGFVEAQQAVIDEDAGQLFADRALNQRRSDRGIDAARKTENHLFVPTWERILSTASAT
jgi:hypothetical protein